MANSCMFWLPGQDSNLGQRIQSPLCYHYTTGQWRDEARGLFAGFAVVFGVWSSPEALR